MSMFVRSSLTCAPETPKRRSGKSFFFHEYTTSAELLNAPCSEKVGPAKLAVNALTVSVNWRRIDGVVAVSLSEATWSLSVQSPVIPEIDTPDPVKAAVCVVSA